MTEDKNGEPVLVVRENNLTNREFIDELNDTLRMYNLREEYLRKPFSYQEAATQLGVSRRTLQRWRNTGKVPYIMVGKRPRFTGADIEQIREMIADGLLYEEQRQPR
ncbi:helix-turn-helix domain-containing protein [Kribbella sp. NPDC056861]|uniref:helix-turn-helix domain-containing protein n=1 Tax=Kribbella sp. NPDC056861 TaxID=3154857 RepID=UPI00342C2384